MGHHYSRATLCNSARTQPHCHVLLRNVWCLVAGEQPTAESELRVSERDYEQVLARRARAPTIVVIANMPVEKVSTVATNTNHNVVAQLRRFFWQPQYQQQQQRMFNTRAAATKSTTTTTAATSTTKISSDDGDNLLATFAHVSGKLSALDDLIDVRRRALVHRSQHLGGEQLEQLVADAMHSHLSAARLALIRVLFADRIRLLRRIEQLVATADALHHEKAAQVGKTIVQLAQQMAGFFECRVVDFSIAATDAGGYARWLIGHVSDALRRNRTRLLFKHIALLRAPLSVIDLRDDKLTAVTNGVNDNNNNNNNGILLETYVKRRRLVLSSRKVFYFVELRHKRCYMQVRDLRSNRQLARSPVVRLRHYGYYEVLARGDRVAALFDDGVHFELRLYDDELTQVAQRTFQFALHLHSLNERELVCFTNQVSAERYVTLDVRCRGGALATIDSFGQKIDARQPFYFGDGALIQCSRERLYIHFFDLFTQQHCVKLVRRRTGRVERTLALLRANGASKLHAMRLDASGRLLVIAESTEKAAAKVAKVGVDHTQQRTISYFDSNGDFMFEIACSNLTLMRAPLELTVDDHFYAIDRNGQMQLF